MMGEYNVFSGLLRKYGVPRVVLPNTPACRFSKRGSGSYFIAEAPPDGMHALSAAVSYCRIPFGHEPFLSVAKYVEVGAPKIASVRDALAELGIVEIFYGVRRGPRGGRKRVVRIALRDDVTLLTAKAFDDALAERRIVAVNSESSMGDVYVSFHVVTRELREQQDSLRFLFAAPCRVSDQELPFASAEGSWSSVGEVLDDFSDRFTRPLPFVYTSLRGG